MLQPHKSTDRSAISPAQAVAHAMRLLDTNPEQAERQAQEILKVLPDDMRALFVVGAARRRAGDLGAARTLLSLLVKAQPGSASVQAELGLVLAGLGESERAIEALRRATELQPDEPQTWVTLSDQLRFAGDEQGAAAAYAQHVRASIQDPQLRSAAEALRDGQHDKAERLLRRHLKRAPEDVAALRLLAETAGRKGHLDDAAELLRRCIELAPKFVGARHSLALVLYEQNKAVEAIVEFERLLENEPGEAKYRALLAGCLGQIGAFDRAIEIIEDLLKVHRKLPKLWVNYGQMLRITGRLDEAIAAMKHAIALHPAMGEAYWSLADLKTFRLSEQDIAAIRTQLANQALVAEDRLHLNYALGKAFEDAAAWGESFTHYAEGARLRHAELPYHPDKNAGWIERSKRVFIREFFDERGAGGCQDAAPIFIVGMPRSGSTLIEQILGSHSSIEATMELAELIHMVGRLSRAGVKRGGSEYPEAAALLTAEARVALGAEYVASASRYRRLDRAHFIDKMPSNFFYVALIRLILPRAKIIDIRRHPMAACFSMFKQHFFRGQNFSYDLTDLGRYYCDYVALMDHFDEVLPGFVHRVIYEDMVNDTEAETARLLRFCGLDLEPDCLRYWESGRVVPTHSSEQVRQPIFRTALDQWRHYEPWLEKLRTALEPVMETWRGAR